MNVTYHRWEWDEESNQFDLVPPAEGNESESLTNRKVKSFKDLRTQSQSTGQSDCLGLTVELQRLN